MLRGPVWGQAAGVSVTFVGCKVHSMEGESEEPKDKDPVLMIDAEAARRLSDYTTGGLGILAPRGWHCLGLFGTGGGSLYISPSPVNEATIFEKTWDGFKGPLIEFETADAEFGAGRLVVAEGIARAFPAYRTFVISLLEEFHFEDFELPSGPGNDSLLWKSNEVVEFHTPAQTGGSGTSGRLQRSSDPVDGVMILFPDPGGDATGLWRLSVRLPPDAADLTPTIIQQLEREAEAEREAGWQRQQ